MAVATSSASRAFGREIGLGMGLFTEAELAAADQLVQLSFSSSGGGDEQASSSPRSVNTCTGTPAWEEEEEMGLRPGVELDRRARKRYRLLSELYAATTPVRAAAADATSARKRKRSHEPEAAMVMRYGDQSYRR